MILVEYKQKAAGKSEPCREVKRVRFRSATGVDRRVRLCFFFSSRRRHTRLQGDWSSDVCSSDLMQMLGGWLDQALVDQRWTIIGSKGPVRAITGIRDIHIVPPEERTKVYPRESIFLDVGAKNAAEVAAMGLEPGDPVAPDAPFAVMNGTQNYLGKGWDDRVGCAVVIEAMKKLTHTPHPNQIFWVATVQEEIGVRGAHTSSDLVKPEIGIAIEGGGTRD